MPGSIHQLGVASTHFLGFILEVKITSVIIENTNLTLMSPQISMTLEIMKMLQWKDSRGPTLLKCLKREAGILSNKLEEKD